MSTNDKNFNLPEIDFSQIEDKIGKNARKSKEKLEKQVKILNKNTTPESTPTPKPVVSKPVAPKKEYTEEELAEREKVWRGIKHLIAFACYLVPIVFWQPTTYDAVTGEEQIPFTTYFFLVGMIIHWRFWLVFIGSMIAAIWIEKTTHNFFESFRGNKNS